MAAFIFTIMKTKGVIKNTSYPIFVLRIEFSRIFFKAFGLSNVLIISFFLIL